METLTAPSILRLQQTDPCSHPESTQATLFNAPDYITGDVFEIQRCGECGLTRTAPMPAPDTMSRYYPQGYYGQGKRYGSIFERILNLLYRTRAWFHQRASGGQPGRALDIGCGRGQVLFHLKRRGWEVMGTELSDTSARYAREDLKLDVRTAEVRELDLPSESFDLVILWHVLEHVSEPAQLLGEVRRILRPGGTLLVAVPNFGSLEARFGKAGWFHLDVPRHLNHFTPSVLRGMLSEVGLRPGRASFFAAEYDCFSFVQTVQNRLGLRQNLLYNLLRRRGAKMLGAASGRQPSRFQVTLALLSMCILGALSLLWVPLVALFGQGATVASYAKKPEE